MLNFVVQYTMFSNAKQLDTDICMWPEYTHNVHKRTMYSCTCIPYYLGGILFILDGGVKPLSAF